MANWQSGKNAKWQKGTLRMSVPTTEQRLSSAATAPMSASFDETCPTLACASGPPGGGTSEEKVVEMRRADRKTTDRLRAAGGWGEGGKGGRVKAFLMFGIFNDDAK